MEGKIPKDSLSIFPPISEHDHYIWKWDLTKRYFGFLSALFIYIYFFWLLKHQNSFPHVLSLIYSFSLFCFLLFIRISTFFCWNIFLYYSQKFSLHFPSFAGKPILFVVDFFSILELCRRSSSFFCCVYKKKPFHQSSWFWLRFSVEFLLAIARYFDNDIFLSFYSCNGRMSGQFQV